MFPILIDGHAQDRVVWYVDSRHDRLDFVVMFKLDEPHDNTLRISVGSKSNNYLFQIKTSTFSTHALILVNPNF